MSSTLTNPLKFSILKCISSIRIHRTNLVYQISLSSPLYPQSNEAVCSCIQRLQAVISSQDTRTISSECQVLLCPLSGFVSSRYMADPTYVHHVKLTIYTHTHTHTHNCLALLATTGILFAFLSDVHTLSLIWEENPYCVHSTGAE